MKIIGLDLSLTSTGVAGIVDGCAWTARVVPPAGITGCERLHWISRELGDWTADLTVIEGPAYGTQRVNQRGHHERAGLWWMVRCQLWRAGQPAAVVTPTCLKRYATGRGNAPKDAVLAAAIRRYRDLEFDGNDQADALILAAMAADHYGQPLAPVAAVNRQALAAVDWPGLQAT